MHYCPPPKQVLNDNIMIVTGPADGARSCDDFEMEIHKEMMKKLMYLLQDVSEICDFSRESLIWPLEPMYSLILTHNWLLHRNFFLEHLRSDPLHTKSFNQIMLFHVEIRLLNIKILGPYLPDKPYVSVEMRWKVWKFSSLPPPGVWKISGNVLVKNSKTEKMCTQ